MFLKIKRFRSRRSESVPIQIKGVFVQLPAISNEQRLLGQIKLLHSKLTPLTPFNRGDYVSGLMNFLSLRAVSQPIVKQITTYLQKNSLRNQYLQDQLRVYSNPMKEPSDLKKLLDQFESRVAGKDKLNDELNMVFFAFFNKLCQASEIVQSPHKFQKVVGNYIQSCKILQQAFQIKLNSQHELKKKYDPKDAKNQQIIKDINDLLKQYKDQHRNISLQVHNGLSSIGRVACRLYTPAVAITRIRESTTFYQELLVMQNNQKAQTHHIRSLLDLGNQYLKISLKPAALDSVRKILLICEEKNFQNKLHRYYSHFKVYFTVFRFMAVEDNKGDLGKVGVNGLVQMLKVLQQSQGAGEQVKILKQALNNLE